MYRSSPFRSTLNTGYITCLGMCKVCTKAVHSVALCPAKKAQTPKHVPGKKDRNRARGVFQGRRTSRSAGKYIYIYTYYHIHIKYTQIYKTSPHPPGTTQISSHQGTISALIKSCCNSSTSRSSASGLGSFR